MSLNLREIDLKLNDASIILSECKSEQCTIEAARALVGECRDMIREEALDLTNHRISSTRAEYNVQHIELVNRLVARAETAERQLKAKIEASQVTADNFNKRITELIDQCNGLKTSLSVYEERFKRLNPALQYPSDSRIRIIELFKHVVRHEDIRWNIIDMEDVITITIRLTPYLTAKV